MLIVRKILIILVGLAVLGAVLRFVVDSGSGAVQSPDEARALLLAELEQFSDYADHEALFLTVVDRDSPAIHARAYGQGRRPGRTLDANWQDYRTWMYQALQKELSAADEDAVAVQLSRHRAQMESR